MDPESRAEAHEDFQARKLAADISTRRASLPTVADFEEAIDRKSYRRGVGKLFSSMKNNPRHTANAINLNVERLSPMPPAPTLTDFMERRFAPADHLLQSAALAWRSGASEEIVLACLLHDIGTSLMRAEHGYWSAQLIEPYVSERVAFAVRYHQALRFFPDASVNYEYPQSYYETFGVDYTPPPYIRKAYDYARNHKWYMDARLVTMNDLYAFDPNVDMAIDEFEDIINRHFRQLEEGLGYDGSSVAHTWRTLISPDSPL
jgi:hypothetical protein